MSKICALGLVTCCGLGFAVCGLGFMVYSLWLRVWVWLLKYFMVLSGRGLHLMTKRLFGCWRAGAIALSSDEIVTLYVKRPERKKRHVSGGIDCRQVQTVNMAAAEDDVRVTCTTVRSIFNKHAQEVRVWGHHTLHFTRHASHFSHNAYMLKSSFATIQWKK